MKNLKIGTKLLVTFMIIIILFCVTVYSAITGLQRNAERYSQFYNVGYQITNRVMNMRRGLQIIVKDLTFVTIDDDAEKNESYEEDLNKEMGLLEENVEWLYKNFTGNRELLDSFAEHITNAVELQEQVITLAKTSDKIHAQDMLLDEYQPLVQNAVEVLIEISSQAEKDAETDFTETVQMQKMLVYVQLGLAAGALVITLLVSTYLSSSIKRPVSQLEKAARKIVAGDFDIDVDYKSKDELGGLANAFRNMTDILENVITDASRLLSEMADGNFDVRTRAEDRYVGEFHGLLLSIRKLNRDLSSTLGQINLSSDQVAAGASQVSNGSQALSQGATEQAASVQELASTITNISQQVKETAENAIKARNQTNSAGDEVEECNRQMKDMTKAMDEITRTSNEIGKIIKTIEDIAFQTNILALNAAVEASRAGSAGKGFAVVADEVRSLASKSTEASKVTSDLIESSIGAVAEGTQIANATAESLIKVVEEVRAASATVDKIASDAEAQAGAVEQVSVGVDQISSVVQTNSATAVESAAASEELSSQAEVCKSLVAKFKLREEYIPAGSSAMSMPSDDIQIDLDKY